MRIGKCDRCGVADVAVNTTTRLGSKPKELCAACFELLGITAPNQRSRGCGLLGRQQRRPVPIKDETE
jgi:hypothetical protein